MSIPRTKIVVTLGPSTDASAKILALANAGARIFRLNFSFRDHSYHASIIKRIRVVEKKLKCTLTIIADLQGPKIRLGTLPPGGLVIKNNQTIGIVPGEHASGNILPVKYPHLLREVNVGERLLLDDGKIELKVTEKNKKELKAKVIFGGALTTGKGVGFPDTNLSVQSITAKDIADAKLAEKHGADYIVASFVKNKKDILALKKHLKKNTRVMVKVEKREAVENIRDILTVVDAVMIGRGDLGLELRAGEMTIAQKKIIRASRDAGKPVIVATQMLDSMIRNPRPTRAEITDIANAVIDHTDAVMLSAETSTGDFPLEAVAVAAEIISDTEKSTYDNLPLFSEESAHRTSEAEHLGKLCAVFVRQKKIKGIILTNDNLEILGAITRHRPEVVTAILTKDEKLARMVNLFWGVEKIAGSKLESGLVYGKKQQWWKKGDNVVIIFGRDNLTVKEIK